MEEYPDNLKTDVINRWHELYDFLLDAGRILDLTEVWPKFVLVTKVGLLSEDFRQREEGKVKLFLCARTHQKSFF